MNQGSARSRACVTLLALLWSCGSDPSAATAARADASVDMGLPDASPDVDAGVAHPPDAGVEGGVLDATDARPDARANPEPCDPILQNCVDSVASKCVLEQRTNTFSCGAPLGDAGAGEACTRPANVPGYDTCKAGLYCTGYGQPASTPQARACAALCDLRAPCPAGAPCLSMGEPGSVGFCGNACTLYDDTCGPGQKCAIVQVTQTSATSAGACVPLGTKIAYEPCAAVTDCGKGMGCYMYDGKGQCQPHCDDSHHCADPNAACLELPGLEGHARCRPADLSCVGKVVWPASTSSTASVKLVAADAATGAFVAGATVSACAGDDAECRTPLDTKSTTSAGEVSLSVPTPGQGFTGYFLVSAPGYLTGLVYPSRPVTGDAGVSLPLTTAAGIEAAVVGMAAVDPARGVIVGGALGCDGFPLGGVTWSADLADASTVIAHALPSAGVGRLRSNTYNPLQSAGATGEAIMLNVPAGKATVTATMDGPATLATRSVFVRASSVTLVLAEPSP